MALALKWTQRASFQIQEIESYIATDRPVSAQNEIRKIFASAERLLQFPRLGPVFRRTSVAEYREIVAGNYRIFYVIKPAFDRIDIVTVWHGARGEPELP